MARNRVSAAYRDPPHFVAGLQTPRRQKSAAAALLLQQ